jgi:hypothetical protein
MCKILAPTFWEIIAFNLKYYYCSQSGEVYAQKLIWKKINSFFGKNIIKYVDDWSMLVLSLWVEEDESETSYLEQAIEEFFLNGFDNSDETILKRQYIEDRFMELFRQELLLVEFAPVNFVQDLNLNLLSTI